MAAEITSRKTEREVKATMPLFLFPMSLLNLMLLIRE
jgi:hypothetical protein